MQYTKRQTAKAVLPGFGEVDITPGRDIQIRIGKWNVYWIDGGRYSGPGADLGMYFSTQDQYLKAFRK